MYFDRLAKMQQKKKKKWTVHFEFITKVPSKQKKFACQNVFRLTPLQVICKYLDIDYQTRRLSG